MRTITSIILHCTATFPGQSVTIADITRWHRQRGFTTIGYHYVIDTDGTILNGRPIADVGAHCRHHNANSIGIAYIGGLDLHGTPTDTRTPEQNEALIKLLRKLRQQFPAATIVGHNQLNPAKACPAFDVPQWLKQVNL